ncbi:MAG: hypothetical protein KC636_21925 [Myxococcales bacterium]|nr:hypothetical protein [Myxococcales bacterium]
MRAGRAPIYVGVLLVAQASLMLEILMTRITSVIAWYHLAFFVIALAMLGMTAGAIVVFLWPERFTPAQAPARMASASLAAALITPIAAAAAMANPLSPVVDFMSFVGLVLYGGALSLPFALFGITLTVALTRAELPPGKIYGVDLCGAAMGCVAVIPALELVDGPSAVLLTSALAAAGALCFALAARGQGVRPRSVALGLLAVLGALVCNLQRDPPPLRPAWVKGVREDPSLLAYTGWNTYSRVTVSKSFTAPPVLWAAGRLAPPSVLTPIEQRTILIDGAAGTSMVKLDRDGDGDDADDAADHAYLGWDVTSFAHRLRPTGPAAVIGVGGGRDVIEAARVGHAPVVGVELNADIVALHEREMAAFSGLTALPGVRLVADEARSFMTRDRERYAVITMSLIDTWASTGAGAYTLSENGLYTREAWVTFLRRLQPDGVFTVSRWYKADSPGETARMLALAMESLWELGAVDPRAHIILLQHHHVATLLLSPTPFSASDLDRMQREAVAMGVNMLLTPRKRARQPYLSELSALDDRAALWSWSSSQELDLTPPTDARPFFFNMLRPGDWLEDPGAIDSLDLSFLGNLRATQTLVFAILASALLTGLAVVAPLWLRRRQLFEVPRGELVAACGYFALIGLGFMFVEIGLLSRLGVYLGHPTLALAVALGGIILWTGVGSLASERVPVTRRPVARLFPLAPALLTAAALSQADVVMAATAGLTTGPRVLVSLALLAPPALGMGLCFPLGLRLVAARGAGRSADLRPWLWGINGACGVCASGLALALSLAWGIDVTLSLGAACYALLLPCAWRLAPS